MRRSFRRFTAVLFMALCLAATLILGGLAQAQTSGKGGGKTPPPPNIPRPICFAGYVLKGNYTAIRRSDVNGSSLVLAATHGQRSLA